MAAEEGLDDYTQDGTVDLKGNPVLRSKSGGWTAFSFVVVYEVFEGLAYFGVVSNLIIYLTKELHQGIVTSANNVTNWSGAVWLTPILGAYIADAHLGRYWTFIISALIYLMGLALLTLAVSLRALRPPPCQDANVENCKEASTLQLAVFYGALYTLAVGSGGTKPNISTIGADQFDDFDPKEKAQKLSFFNWWMFAVFFGIFFANTVLVWIQDNVGWTLGYALPTIGIAISIAVFVAGTPFYRHKLPTGSPITRMAQVIVAATRKWRECLPHDPKHLYELDMEVYGKKGNFKIESTPTMSFLNKAAIKTNSTSPWMVCPVTQVEETKQMVRLLPFFVSTFIPSIMMPLVSTLFVSQGTTLQRDIGSFKIPPAGLTALVPLSTLITILLYDRLFVKMMRKWTGNPRGITLLQRMGIGNVVVILLITTASLVERYRLKVARENGVVDDNGGQVPLSIFILLPQFVLMGISDAFFLVAKVEFFYDQAPENMKSLGSSYGWATVGIGNYLSTFLLSVVSDVTKQYGHGWILNNLNASHLDYYYGFLALLCLLNFFFFLFLSKIYVYRAEVSDSMKVLAKEWKATTIRESNRNEQ